VGFLLALPLTRRWHTDLEDASWGQGSVDLSFFANLIMAGSFLCGSGIHQRPFAVSQAYGRNHDKHHNDQTD
jgi:hypothetical protein